MGVSNLWISWSFYVTFFGPPDPDHLKIETHCKLGGTANSGHRDYRFLAPVLTHILPSVHKPSRLVRGSSHMWPSLELLLDWPYSCGLQPSPTVRAVYCDPGVTHGITHVSVQLKLQLSPNRGGSVWEGGIALTGNTWVN